MATGIDWEQIGDEATTLLRAYLRIDTSNPPGNEAEAVAWLGGLLEAEGIAFDEAVSAPGRSNLRAHLGPPKGVCLLNHTDVVPVERQYWEVEPFAGEMRDGMIWGRGALDMKGMGVIELVTFLLAKRTGMKLRRGLTFLAAADEEAGSAYGVSWLAKHRPEWLESDLVINEGAYGLAGLGAKKAVVFQIAPSEKVPLWVKLVVRGRPGHGSVPHGDNCAEHLVQALERVTGWSQELRLTPVMEAHLEALVDAGVLPDERRKSLTALAQSPSLRARLSNTISLTMIETGIKANVIPAIATATLDCRLLPDVDVDGFLAELKGVVADDRVQMEVLNRYDGGPASIHAEFEQVIEDVIGEMVEGAYLAPEMTSGFTDSRIYRTRGVPSFGFVPCLVDPEDLAGIHGHNERISAENLKLGVQILYQVVRRLCAEENA